MFAASSNYLDHQAWSIAGDGGKLEPQPGWPLTAVGAMAMSTGQQTQVSQLVSGQPVIKGLAGSTLGGGKQPPEFIQASSREIEKQIVDKILGEGYDKRIRPAGSSAYNASRPGE